MVDEKLNAKAKRLRQLCKPGEPLVLTNVYDGASAKVVAAHKSTKALATASYAVAGVIGVADADLQFEDNIAGIKIVQRALADSNLPLTADLQDCYEDVAATIKSAIDCGVVGCNIEDLDGATGDLRSVDDAVSRVKTALKAAADNGVPDFCVNARTDVLYHGGGISDAIARGKAYLNAGATTVYIWGGPKGRGVSRNEIKELVQGLGGMINVKMNLRPGFLTAKDLAELGVARISIGPELYVKAMNAFNEAFETAAKGESFT